MKFALKLLGLFLISGLIVTSFTTNGLADNEISPVVPSLASFILPGAGQLLNDQPEKALTHFVVIVGIDTATYLMAGTFIPRPWTFYRIGTALHLAWSGYSAYDAYQVASRRRSGIFGSSFDLVASEKSETELKIASSSLTTRRVSREFSVSSLE